MNDTSITVKDLFKILNNLSPIMILIDGKVEWTDDIELDENDGIAFEQVRSNRMKYYDVIDRNDLVLSFHVNIVDFHHSIVHINLKK